MSSDFERLVLSKYLNNVMPPKPLAKPPMETMLAGKLKSFGITDPEEQAGVLAQLKAESNFKPRSESLRYSPERLYSVFPKYFKDLEDAKYYRVDISKAPAAKKEYKVRMAPTILIFKNGSVEKVFKAGLDLLLPTNLGEIQEVINEINEASKF